MILTGDCLEVMPTLEAEGIDAIVTDPPYGLGFMGKHWDHGVPGIDFWREMGRLAKPSAYLLAFGGTRTVHRMTCAIEDAGWIIRDMLVWAYASGFPKSKASLKPAWEPIVMARKPGPLRMLAIDECRIPISDEDARTIATARGFMEAGWHGPDTGIYNKSGDVTIGAIPAAGRWPANIILTDPIFDGGWDGVVGGGETAVARVWGPSSGEIDGTSFERTRPAGESPFVYGDSGTYSRFFSVPVTMGACRYCGVPIADESSTASPTLVTQSGTALEPASSLPSLSPSDHAPSAAIPSGDPGESSAPLNAELWDGEDGASSWASPDTSGIEARSSNESAPTTPPTPRNRRRGTSLASESRSDRAKSAAPSETSSATTTTTRGRLMCDTCADLATAGYIPDATPTGRRASRAVPADSPDYTRFLIIPKADRTDREPVLHPDRELPFDNFNANVGNTLGKRRINSHPTVKPVDLMRHLVRLVTPADGVVLDPFLGSGTTAIAAEMEGFGWIGIEKEPEYVAIAEARLLGTQRGMGLVG